MDKCLRAVEHIRRMRGGAQAHLLRCSDGGLYVSKSPNNCQGRRILVNELLGSRLAALLGLPVADSQVVFVPQDLIRCSVEMVMEYPRGTIPCQAGSWFGSRYPVDPRLGKVCEMAPLDRVTNRFDFLGMLVFDKWTCNIDGRQVVFFRKDEKQPFRAVMIDQGFCFNAAEWNFPDAPLRGHYFRADTYDCVTGIDAFEPWLSRLESEIDGHALLAAAQEIPSDWYEGEKDSFFKLLETLDRRRTLVRGLVHAARKGSFRLFPNWVNDHLRISALGGLQIRSTGPVLAEPEGRPSL